MSLAELLKADLEDLEEQDEDLDSQMNNDNMNDDEIEDVGMAEEVPEEEEHDDILLHQAEHGRSKRTGPSAGSEPAMIPLMNR